MLTDAEFDLYFKATMIVVAVGWALMLFWPFVTDYRRACRVVRDLELMAVADAVFGPDMERIP